MSTANRHEKFQKARRNTERAVKARHALVHGFIWKESKYGEDYWSGVAERLAAEAAHFSQQVHRYLTAPVRVSHYFHDDESSLVRAIAWEDDMLTVALKTGPTYQYQYQDVPKEVFHEFARAKSPGKFFNTCIKGKYVQHYTAA